MSKRNFLRMAAASMAAIFVCAGFSPVRAQTSEQAALTGQVSSMEEGAMEGVLVSAKRDGSTVTVTVVSDAQGRYSFPRSRLEPGRHALHIRAVGYDLEEPGPVEIAAQQTTTLHLKLRKTVDLASQLSNAEWSMSVPGTEEQKNGLAECVSCHSVERIVRSRHDAAEWVQVLQRMDYFVGSTPLRPQGRVKLGRRPEAPREGGMGGGRGIRSQPDYLARINLSSGPQWNFPLKTLPRPKGRATRVIITEYDLPRRASIPHDAAVDSEGMVWYADFGHQYVGKLDPKTGKVVEYPVPELKPGFPHGMLDVELDKAGDVWFGMMVQGGVAKFDKKTQKIQSYRLPDEMNTNVAQIAMVMPWQHDVDGKVWTNNVGIRGMQRLDVRTGEFERFEPYRIAAAAGDLPPDEILRHSVYGISADSKNNAYFNDFGGGKYIGKIDAKTGKVTLYATPTPNSRPRRGHMDSQDRLWFAEYGANQIAMFDTRTEHFQEWAVPTPYFKPYDVVSDKNGEVWTGGMTADRVLRLDPKTGQFTEYLLPAIDTNIRRVFVYNSTTPVTFWVGDDHGATLNKLEPLD